MSEPTTRQFKLGDRQWFAVEGEEGAITFFVQGRGKNRIPGDLGYHVAADEPQPSGPDDDDPFWMTGCDFTQTRGCRYSGFQSQGALEVLDKQGSVALFDKLTDIYHRHFTQTDA